MEVGAGEVGAARAGWRMVTGTLLGTAPEIVSLYRERKVRVS